VSEKRSVLHKAGKDFKELPGWQKHGVGLFWETYTAPSVNQLTGETVLSRRKRIRVEYALPVKDEYARFILKLIGA